MFDAAPMKKDEGKRFVTPKVFLLSATPDPLGALAAAFRMYAGIPTYSLDQIDDDYRKWAWEESLKTHLKAPWEFIDLHFFIEGVTRSFTHQMVRQRTAVFAQESLRFAVKRGFASETALPPSIVDPDEGPGKIWADTVATMEQAYEQLVDAGIPAEDARGLLPHCVTTRLNYKTNFRNLIEHAGMRLCTQAQFEWRAVFIGIMNAIGTYDGSEYIARIPNEDILFESNEERGKWKGVDGHRLVSGKWQFELLAKPISQTFTPVCYKAGKCVFMGDLDRGCTIRERVNEGKFDEINPLEWMANPMAGITTDDNTRPNE
jgi:flavin-dependent thymidylate synthase